MSQENNVKMEYTFRKDNIVNIFKINNKKKKNRKKRNQKTNKKYTKRTKQHTIYM